MVTAKIGASVMSIIALGFERPDHRTEKLENLGPSRLAPLRIKVLKGDLGKRLPSISASSCRSTGYASISMILEE